MRKKGIIKSLFPKGGIDVWLFKLGNEYKSISYVIHFIKYFEYKLFLRIN
jgi:hypothetical protein